MEVFDKTVSLWIAVNIGDEMDEVSVIVDYFTPEGFLEEATGALVRFVVCFCVCAEQVGKGTTWRIGRAVLDAYEEVKMVVQQAVGIGICSRFDILCIQFQEVAVVTLFSKQRLSAITAIVDMIVLSAF